MSALPQSLVERARDAVTTLAQWTVLGSLVGVVSGGASALFLVLLERATSTRLAHEELVYGLPFAGLALGFAFERWGQPIRGGNDLVIDTIHDEGPELPLRMAPMALLGTVVTHLFGGSAGREGTAVQMGASLADFLAGRLQLTRVLRRQLLAAGVAGGFGSVFGTPIAGTIFGLEFVVLGRLEYGALAPALLAALVGDWTTRALGVSHASYPAAPSLALTPLLLAKWFAFAIAVAAVTAAFIELTHWLKKESARHVPSLPLRMFLGGALVVAMAVALGTTDYLGLGVPGILRAFESPAVGAHVFALKLLFTAVTLGAGFIGGEVTPLFFVGAALGSALGHALGIPIPLGAAVGLASVFAAASNAPLALSVMAVELVGANVLPHAAVVCVLAFLLTGHRSIYPAQRVMRTKRGALLDAATPLRTLRDSASSTDSNAT